jgi:Holliday junction resolvase-like predicted endonuclease
MDANDCREYSTSCIEMANEAVTNASQTKLLRWAEAWLRLAEEIDNDASLRNQVRAVTAIKRVRRVSNRIHIQPAKIGKITGAETQD